LHADPLSVTFNSIRSTLFVNPSSVAAVAYSARDFLVTIASLATSIWSM
jgi:hypothetical protein